MTGGRLDAMHALARGLRQLPARDSDGDGSSNLVEYLAGTRIDSVGSRPVPLAESGDGILRLSLPRVPRSDAHLVIERSTDLLSWTRTGVTDSSTSTLLRGEAATSGLPSVFLRIVANPIPAP